MLPAPARARRCNVEPLRNWWIEAADRKKRKLVLRPGRGFRFLRAQLLILAAIEEQGAGRRNAITFILDPGRGQEMNIYFGPSGPEVALKLEIAEADQFRDWLKTKARSAVRAA